MRVLLIGKTSGRLDCLAEAICKNERAELFILTNFSNRGLTAKGFVTIGPTEDPDFVADYAEKYQGPKTLAIISNEEPLANGVVDRLLEIGIPTVGPTKALAQIETSKIFTRKLLEDNVICSNIGYGDFSPGEIQQVRSLMVGMRDFVIKPDGLTGGKGVMVRGDHFTTIEEGLTYCEEIFAKGGRLLIEKKKEGQEFSLMSFSDGSTVVDMPFVQDHKRLREKDKGPNTGGMGSYSDANHALPFMVPFETRLASFLNRKVIECLQKQIGSPYRGILYGSYIIAKWGHVLSIEYNARFGDPEVLNVLPLLETDFVELCWAMATGTMTPEHVKFANKATVCKYLVPHGHPNEPVHEPIDTSDVVTDENTRIYHGGLDGDVMTGSRAVALVGIADTIYDAEKLAEAAARQVRGPVIHRRDIGTEKLIAKRIDHADKLRTLP